MSTLTIASGAYTATLQVCPSGCPYTSIQTAVNAASPGDTIQISSGVFWENISIHSKSLAFKGAEGVKQ
jgi:pectin methylesterase-like acyl-CoA thioesterase